MTRPLPGPNDSQPPPPLRLPPPMIDAAAVPEVQRTPSPVPQRRPLVVATSPPPKKPLPCGQRRRSFSQPATLFSGRSEGNFEGRVPEGP